MEQCYIGADGITKNVTTSIPGVGFNPMNTSHWLGLVDPKYYRFGTYQLQDETKTLVQGYGIGERFIVRSSD